MWKNTNYYHQDVLGSTMALSDRNGNVVERYLYDVFGNAYEGTFQRANELGYTGQRYDAATGWYNYGYRDYAPAVGRFTTVDPIRDGNNWYAYVGNDPVNFVDPTGLDAVDFYDALKNGDYDSSARGHRYEDYMESTSNNKYFIDPEPKTSKPKTEKSPYESWLEQEDFESPLADYLRDTLVGELLGEALTGVHPELGLAFDTLDLATNGAISSLAGELASDMFAYYEEAVNSVIGPLNDAAIEATGYNAWLEEKTSDGYSVEN